MHVPVRFYTILTYKYKLAINIKYYLFAFRLPSFNKLNLLPLPAMHEEEVFNKLRPPPRNSLSRYNPNRVSLCPNTTLNSEELVVITYCSTVEYTGIYHILPTHINISHVHLYTIISIKRNLKNNKIKATSRDFLCIEFLVLFLQPTTRPTTQK